MKLKNLIIDGYKVYGNLETEISSISFSSKNVKKNSLFVCLKGENFDGHNFVEEAIKQGASAILTERKLDFAIPQIVCKNSRKGFAEICARFYGEPQKKLKLIGITGTNGKTTTSHIIKKILETAGKKVGLIGTQGSRIGNRKIRTNLTTPDPDELFLTLKKMADKNVEYVVMEVSAHALALNKIYGLCFEIGILTNITEDHLDFFKNMQAYEDAKISFFNSNFIKSAVVNIDDEKIRKNLNKINVPIVTYGLKNPSDVFALDIVKSLDGTSFVVNYFDNVISLQTCLVGEFNVYNILAGICACALLGVYGNPTIQAFKKIVLPLGRFNVFNLKDDLCVVIDYAHTPDGMKNVLKTIKEVDNRKLICVFGCGGNREQQKRAIMGEIAENFADFVVLTNDNPRFEVPEKIIADIESGMKKTNHICIADRKEATKYALKISGGEAIIALLGKGDETMQEINGEKYPYNDFEEIKNSL